MENSDRTEKYASFLCGSLKSPKLNLQEPKEDSRPAKQLNELTQGEDAESVTTSKPTTK